MQVTHHHVSRRAPRQGFCCIVYRPPINQSACGYCRERLSQSGAYGIGPCFTNPIGDRPVILLLRRRFFVTSQKRLVGDSHLVVDLCTVQFKCCAQHVGGSPETFDLLRPADAVERLDQGQRIGGVSRLQIGPSGELLAKLLGSLTEFTWHADGFAPGGDIPAMPGDTSKPLDQRRFCRDRFVQGPSDSHSVG